MSDTGKQRKPGFLPLEGPASGRIVRDDQGNAVWKWDGKREEMNGSFHHLGLSIEGQEPAPPPPPKTTKARPKAAGYDPYQVIGGNSPNAEKPKAPKRTDLRALSRHIALQRLVKGNTNDEDEES